MIIGNGAIANVLIDREDLVFFASGVSNSSEKRESEFQREIDLLFEQDRDSHLVYFSSIAVFNTNSPYFNHKRLMETLIKENFKHYTIIRMGNICWPNKNPHTIINFLKNKINNKKSFEIRDEYKYLINEDEFLHIISLIPNWSCEMTIFGTRLSVHDIVSKIKKGEL